MLLITLIELITLIQYLSSKNMTFYVCRIFSKRHCIVCGRLQTSKDKNKPKKQCTTEGTYKSRRIEWMRSSQAFVDGVYRKSCFPFRSVMGSQRKKHSLAVDKLEYFLVDVLRGEECREGTMVFFPQVNTNEYARVSRYRGHKKTNARNKRRLDEKGVPFAPIFLFSPSWKEKKLSRSEINFSNFGV